MKPVESANRWHRWSVKGTKDVLTRVLDSLDAKSLPGWTRLSGEALQPFQPLVRPESVWFSLEATPVHSGLTLSVERWGDSVLRGGRVWFSGPPYPSPTPGISAAWDEVMRFLDEVIAPNARGVGATVFVPTPEAMFLDDLPPEAAERLRKFSRLARKVLPLDRDEAKSWRAFVIGAYRAEAIVDAPRLVDWLVHEGWERSDAADLSLRFFDQCVLLALYAEEVSAA